MAVEILTGRASFTMRLYEFGKIMNATGSPRFVVTNAFALGSSAAERGATQACHYNLFLGSDGAEQAARRVLSEPEAISGLSRNLSRSVWMRWSFCHR